MGLPGVYQEERAPGAGDGDDSDEWEDIPPSELLLQDAFAWFLPRWAKTRQKIAWRAELRQILADSPILQRDFIPFYDKPPFRQR